VKLATVLRAVPGALGMLLLLRLLGGLFPEYVFHWDEVQLTLGLERFDPRSHQPHPPGYYLFVILGRVLRPFVVTPEDALRWVAAGAGAAFAGLVGWWLPAGLRFWARSGLVAAAVVFVVCSPIVLFHSVAALTYTTEAACWLAILLGVSRRPRGRGLVLLAAGIGLAGGLRQTLIVWGVVLVAVAWLLERSWLDGRAALRFVGGLVVGTLLWTLPMLVEVGGWGEYAAVSGAMLQGNIWEKTLFHEGLATLTDRLTRMPADLWLAAGPWLAVAGVGLALRFRERFRERLARWDLLPIGAGCVFAFYLFLIYDSDGYILAVAVPLVAYALLVAGEVVAVGSVRLRTIGVVAAILVAGSLVLLPGGFASEGDRGYGSYAPHDEMLDGRIEAIRRAFRPDSTVLVTSHEYWQWSFRHVMYYLPDYTTVQLLPDRFFADAASERPYLTGHDHEISFTGPDGFDVRSLGGALEQVVYVIPHDVPQYVSESCAPYLRPFPTVPGEMFGVLRLADDYEVHVSRARLHCRPKS
jgi:hypothetical protein